MLSHGSIISRILSNVHSIKILQQKFHVRLSIISHFFAQQHRVAQYATIIFCMASVDCGLHFELGARCHDRSSHCSHLLLVVVPVLL